MAFLKHVSARTAVAKATQEPQLPWFLTGVTKFLATELYEAGTVDLDSLTWLKNLSDSGSYVMFPIRPVWVATNSSSGRSENSYIAASQSISPLINFSWNSFTSS